MKLNDKLVRQQKLDQKEIDEIMALHDIKRSVMIDMAGLDPKKEFPRLMELRNKITQLEFSLQEIWKFPENENFHRFWELPHCSCPRMDNEDRWGTKYRVYAAQCILHGVTIPKGE